MKNVNNNTKKRKIKHDALYLQNGICQESIWLKEFVPPNIYTFFIIIFYFILKIYKKCS